MNHENKTNQEPNLLTLLAPLLPSLLEQLTGQKLTPPNNSPEILAALANLQRQQLQHSQELMKLRQDFTNLQTKALEYLQPPRLTEFTN